MKTRYAQLFFLALTGIMLAPTALAGHGNHARDHRFGSGIVIHLGPSHGGHFHAAHPKPPAHHQYQQGYRQGYRDGYHAGSHDHRRQSRHHNDRRIPTWRDRYADVLPSAPHRSHSHRRSNHRH